MSNKIQAMPTLRKYLLDTLKQKLSAKSQKLRQYKEANVRKQQNRVFTTNKKPTAVTSKVKDSLIAEINYRTNRFLQISGRPFGEAPSNIT